MKWEIGVSLEKFIKDNELSPERNMPLEWYRPTEHFLRNAAKSNGFRIFEFNDHAGSESIFIIDNDIYSDLKNANEFQEWLAVIFGEDKIWPVTYIAEGE